MNDDGGNLYGYSDYKGPYHDQECNEKGEHEHEHEHEYDSDDSDEHDPLRVGRWMEGDSLAPPCGASVPIVHAMLELAGLRPAGDNDEANNQNVNENDTTDEVLYDLGCGDGRVCLEARGKYRCRRCIGVEVESDLVERFRDWIRVCRAHEGAGTDDDDDDDDDGWNGVEAVHADLNDVLDALLARTNDEGDGERCPLALPVPLPPPSILCMYLLPESIRAIEPKLVRLLQQRSHNNNLRIVCNTWGLSNELTPVQTVEATGRGVNESAELLLYTRESLPR